MALSAAVLLPGTLRATTTDLAVGCDDAVAAARFYRVRSSVRVAVAYPEQVGTDTTAKCVGFECADGYYEGIDRLSDAILPTRYGYPFKIRIPTKSGFKNTKFVTTIFVANQQPRGFWTDRGYNWFSGI